MCRIFGFVSNNITRESSENWIQRMDSRLSHGGPDDSGYIIHEEPHYVLGHRRLSIMDPSPLGHQPMSNSSQNIWLSFNGEIYNFNEIKKELLELGHVFISHSDTEVIIHAYEAWGEDAFDMFNGMFAFALTDHTKKILYLVRDRNGIKPLYYYRTNDVFAFASEVRGVSCLPIAHEENPDWKIFFLAFGHMPEPYTTLKDVWMLPKGKYARYCFEDKSFSISTFINRKTAPLIPLFFWPVITPPEPIRPHSKVPHRAE